MKCFIKRAILSTVMMALTAPLVLTSCTNDAKEEPLVEVHSTPQSDILMKLETYNASITSATTRKPLKCDHTPGSGLCWFCWLKIMMRDSWGSLAGAIISSPLTSVQGTAFGEPIIGATIIGAASSYHGCIRMSSPGFSEAQTTSAASSENDCKVFTAGYADAKDKLVKSDYELGIALGLDSCATQIAILHNKVLECVDDIKLKGNQDELVKKLNSTEKTLIDSKDFVTAFQNIVFSASDQPTVAQTTREKVMTMFDDAVKKGCSDRKSLSVIISDYVNFVKEGNDLSDTDKQYLYIAFAVAAYSFDYWSVHAPYTES